MMEPRRTSFSHTVARYAFAVLAVTVALLAWQSLVRLVGDLPHYVTFYPAVMLTAILAGIWPGLLATGLAAIAAAYWILPPHDSFLPMTLNNATGLSIFCGMGVFMCIVAELYHRGRRREVVYEKELAVREAQALAAVETERQRQLLAVTLMSIGDGVIVTDAHGDVTFLNPEAERLTGWSNNEASGRPIVEVFKILNEHTRQTVENPIEKVLRLRTTVGLANHTVLIARDGREIPIDDSGAPVRSPDGEVHGVVLVFRDFTEKKQTEALLRARLRLSELVQHASIDELIRTGLDEAEGLTNSCIGYFHLVDEDQQNLTLQSWSTNTLRSACRAEGQGLHYPICKAGVWVDCLHARAPVIHNDYANLPHKKGLPEGHTPIVRDLGVPVLRGDRVVAIIGVGNKATDYTQDDVRVLQSLALPLVDLAGYKRAEQALRESEARYRNLFTTMSEGFALHELLCTAEGLPYDYRFLEVNPAFEEATGLKAADVVGRTLREVLPESEPVWLQRYSRVVLSGEPDHFEDYHEQTGRWYEVYASRTVPGQFAVVFLNVTDRKRVEESLLEAKVAAEAANEAKGRFLANISHELRTPMNAILGMFDLALPKQVDPTAKDLLQTAKQSADLLLTLLNDLLDSAKIESGNLELESAPFSLRRVLDHTTQVLAVRASEKGICFSSHITADVPDVLIGDQVRLRQILLNLAGNGIKFTEQGEVVLTVSTESQDAREACLKFTVQDTGIGIPRSELERVFRPFAQADPSTTRRFGGTGLGLSIASNLVGRMRGRIWVESEPDRGSIFCFTIRVPLAKELPPQSEVVNAFTAATSMLRVLLVDDNPANQKLAAYILQDRGHAVDIAGDGLQGVAMTQQNTYDVILMDVQMPGMDGLAATKAVRAQENGSPRVPIIAMTAHAMKGDRERCLAAGMDGYLSKPINGHEMIALLESLAAGSPTAAAGTDSPSRTQTPSEAPTTSPAVVFDLELALERCLNRQQMLVEMVRCFFDEVDSVLPEMRAALQKGDLTEVGRLAHRLKGTVVYLGAKPVEAAAFAAEKLGKHNDNHAEAAKAVEALEQQCRILRSILAAHPAATCLPPGD